MIWDWVLPFRAPVAWLTLADATAVCRTSKPILRAARAEGSAWMRTAYLAAPPTSTWATPSMVESCRASMVSAYSSSCEGLTVSDHMAMKMMGWSVGLTLRKVGGTGRLRGSARRAPLIAACTSWAAASMLRSRLNWMEMLVMPWRDD